MTKEEKKLLKELDEAFFKHDQELIENVHSCIFEMGECEIRQKTELRAKKLLVDLKTISKFPISMINTTENWYKYYWRT